MKLTMETKKDITADMLTAVASKGLMEWLEESGYYTQPAAKVHHGAKEGGLFDHSLQVAYELINLTKRLDLKWQREESPAIIGMLHDICKLDQYSLEYELPFPEKDEVPKIVWNKQQYLPGHGEKSLIMLMGKADLTEEEIMCIRYHMGAFTDKEEWEFYSRAVNKWPNVLYTHTADMIASQIKGV